MTTNSESSASGSPVSLNAIRGQVMQRLLGVHQRLEGKGLGSAFLRAVKPDPIGDMGFLSSMIVNMILCGPLSDLMGLDASDSFNEVAVAGGLETMTILRDLNAYTYYGRNLNFYPEGRRKCALEAGRTSKKFNLVSANQNNRFSFDVQAELACMYEILDMLDQMEKMGVKLIPDTKRPIYDLLRQSGKKLRSTSAVKSMPAPVILAA